MKQSLFRRSAAVFDPRHYGFLASTIRQHSYNWEHYTTHPTTSLPTSSSSSSSSTTNVSNQNGHNSEGYVPDYPVDVILHYRANGIPLTDIIRGILPMLLAEDSTLIERILPPSVSHVCTTATHTNTGTRTNGLIGGVQGAGSSGKGVVSISGDLTAEPSSVSTSNVKATTDTGVGTVEQPVKPSVDDVYTQIINFLFPPPADPDPHNTLNNTTTSQAQAMDTSSTTIDLTPTLTPTHSLPLPLAAGHVPKGSAQKRDSHYTASSSGSSSGGVKEGDMSPRIQQGQKRHKVSNSNSSPTTHPISSPLPISTSADGADLEKVHNSDPQAYTSTCKVELSSKEWRIFALCEVYKLANDAKMVRELYNLITYSHAVIPYICVYVNTIPYLILNIYIAREQVYTAIGRRGGCVLLP